jgi:hypothetical protein
MFSRWENILVILLILVGLAACGVFILQAKNSYNKVAFIPGGQSNILNSIVTAVLPVSLSPTPIPPPQKLVNPPEIIKGIYVTGYSAGSKKYLDYLTALLKNTEINAVVVNIKDSDGYVSYASGAEEAKKYNLYNYAIKDIDALVRFFHDKNIYVIGRIVVFEDPAFAKARPDLAIYDKAAAAASPSPSATPGEGLTPSPSPIPKPVLWKDNRGLAWLDPASKDVWDYNVSLAQDAFSHGFDEINFDYVRFPSDGNIKNMGFHFWDGKNSKADALKSFFKYLRQQLAGEKISVDLFGQTTTDAGDMGIGQTIENAFENFDYISPMVYPSHYINGFLGYDNPADYPYEIVNYSMATALSRENNFLKSKESPADTINEPLASPYPYLQTPTLSPSPLPSPTPPIILAKFRPWLQDFNMGAFYTADMVKSEIKATQDALGEEYSGFMLWNPSNIYKQEAVKKPEATPPN